MPTLVKRFLEAVQSFAPSDPSPSPEKAKNQKGRKDDQSLLFVERSCELLTDLLAQLHTRRFLRTLLDDLHVVETCALSPLGDSCRPPLPHALTSLPPHLGFVG